MRLKIFKTQGFGKTFLMAAGVLMILGLSVMASDASFKPNPLYPARNMITYEPPEWGTSGNLMSDADVVKRFSVLVYGHNQMRRYLPRYKSAGYNGDALLYLIADAVGGPQNLASTYAQSKTCTELGINPNLDVISAFATMDTGDLCQIHDAIAYRKRGVTDPNKICLVADGYPDICPTENWFVHKSDGSRYEKVRSGYSGYQPNPGDVNWRRYFARRALRELVYGYQPGYEFVSGIDGLFIDNLEVSWSKVKDAMGTIKEYSSDCAYTKTVRDFASYVHSKLHDSTKGYNFPVWANMISDSTYDPCGIAANSWIPFENYLEGGLDESFILNWGRGPYSSSHAEREMNIGSYWSKKGKHFVATIQADNGPSYNMYAFAAYLMTTDGVNGSYKYSDNPGGAYSHYFTMPGSSYPDYNYPLGRPTGDKYLSNSTTREWKRNFQCGQVTVNLTYHTGSINLVSNCNPASPTPIPTRLPTATIRPTNTPTTIPTSIPTVRPTNTPTIRPTNTPTTVVLKPGDANGDGRVDLLDYVIWLNHFNQTTSNGPGDGDFNRDSKVDLLDYVIWLTNFGK